MMHQINEYILECEETCTVVRTQFRNEKLNLKSFKQFNYFTSYLNKNVIISELKFVVTGRDENGKILLV